MAHCDSTAARSTVTMCYIAHKGGICVHEASRLEQPVDSAVEGEFLKSKFKALRGFLEGLTHGLINYIYSHQSICRLFLKIDLQENFLALICLSANELCQLRLSCFLGVVTLL